MSCHVTCLCRRVFAGLPYAAFLLNYSQAAAQVGLICGIKLAREALSEPPSPLLKAISPELADGREFAGSPEFGL